MARKSRSSNKTANYAAYEQLVPLTCVIWSVYELVIQERIDIYANYPHDRGAPRPVNGFMLFRSYFWKIVKSAPGFNQNNRDLSVLVGELWDRVEGNVRDAFLEGTHRIKEAHLMVWPDYTFRPNGRSSTTSRVTKAAAKSGKVSSKKSAPKSRKVSRSKAKKNTIYDINKRPTRASDLVAQTPLPSPPPSSASTPALSPASPASPFSSRSSTPSIPSLDGDCSMSDEGETSSLLATPQSVHEELSEFVEEMDFVHSPFTSPSMALPPVNPEDTLFTLWASDQIVNTTLTDSAFNYSGTRFYRSAPCAPLRSGPFPKLEQSALLAPFGPFNDLFLPELNSNSLALDLGISDPKGEEEGDIDLNEWLNSDVILRDD